jgi:Domain of unknown function (DUF5047)
MPISTRALSMLRGSHAIDVRATAFSPNQAQYSDLPITGGSVTDDSTSQVRRSATVYIADPNLWPRSAFDSLSPYGSELQIDYGIVVPGLDTEWIPLIRGVVQTDIANIPETSQGLQLTLADRSQFVHDDQAPVPIQVGGSGTIPAAIKALILSTYPTVAFLDLTGNTTVAPAITIQQDRWTEGVEVYATSIGAECFVDPTGQFVLRPQPTLSDPALWVVETGPSGNLVTSQRTRSRELVYNQVVASGESSTGAAPVTATVTDLDPTSPTYYNGSFGRKPRFLVSAALTTTGQCTAAATALLARAQGADTQVQMTAITNPALQSGDVELLRGSAGELVHIIDSHTVPLDLSGTQAITGRSKQLPPEQGA